MVQGVKNAVDEGKPVSKALNQVCGYMNGMVQGICRALVDSYADEIASLLMDQIDPSAICTAIRACNE